MGGRGKNASMSDEDLNYKTVGYIHGVPVVEGIHGEHSLPECAYHSDAYIRLDKGVFREMRFYDEDHCVYLEIGYHGEVNLTGDYNKKVLHYHLYSKEFSASKDQDFERTVASFLTDEMFERYKKYFKGVKL